MWPESIITPDDGLLLSLKITATVSAFSVCSISESLGFRQGAKLPEYTLADLPCLTSGRVMGRMEILTPVEN